MIRPHQILTCFVSQTGEKTPTGTCLLEQTMYKDKALKQFFALVSGLTASGLSLAHGGHGAGTDSHWHATDSWGLLVGVALVAALWWARKP